MNKPIKESDWKIFKKIKEHALEKFCSIALEEFSEVIAETERDPHERYLMLYKLVADSDKRMSLIFDGHSRSKASLQLYSIRMEKLADEELVAQLSDEFNGLTEPKRIER